MRIALALCVLCAPLSGCDSDSRPRESMADKEKREFEETLGIVKGYRDAFVAVARSLSGPVHPDTPCPQELPHSRPEAYWVGPSSIALTEDALRWFVDNPAETSTDPETVPGWADGALGYLNFDGLADHRVTSIDGARLRVLYDAVSLARYGEKEKHAFSIYETVRRPGMVSLTARQKFTSEVARNRPDYVVVLRDVSFKAPRTPEELPPSEDAVALSKLAKAHNADASAGPVDPELDALVNGAGTGPVNRGGFVAGSIAGVMEIYDAETGAYVCGHRVAAQNSKNFKSYYGGKKAVFDNLADGLAKDANAKFSHPVVRVFEPKE